MKSKPTNDNDTRAGQGNYHLTPSELEAYKLFQNNPDLPLDYKDLIKGIGVQHSTARNILSKLSKLGLIRFQNRTTSAFYELVERPQNAGSAAPVTLRRMGGRKGAKQVTLASVIDSLSWDDVSRVHNLHLLFRCSQVYENAIASGVLAKNASGDLLFARIPWANRGKCVIILHKSHTVSVHIQCTNYPLEVSVSGLLSLTSFLENIRQRLTFLAKEPIPEVAGWVVAQWHFGKDTIQEVSGLSFNITFVSLWNELFRVYTHKNGKKTNLRIERIESPQKRLDEAIAEKLGFGCPCPWGKNLAQGNCKQSSATNQNNNGDG